MLRNSPLRRRVPLGCLCFLLVLVVPVAARGVRQVCRQPVTVEPHLLALQRQLAAPLTDHGAPSSALSRLFSPARTALAQGTGLLMRLKGQDALAYPAHVALAESLTTLHCSPYAVAEQWLKAGAHATTPQQAGVVQAGLRQQAGSVGGAATVAAYLNQFLNPDYDPRGRSTIDRLERTDMGPPSRPSIAMFASAGRCCATLTGRP